MAFSSENNNNDVMLFVSYDGGRTLHVLRPDNTVFPSITSEQLARSFTSLQQQQRHPAKKTKGAERGQLGSIVRLEGTQPNHSAWIQLAGIAKRYPGLNVVAVISPNKGGLDSIGTGAGSSVDSNYTNGIRLLKANNITVLGAVNLKGGTRSEEEVRNDIEHWKILYNDIDGIFLDHAEDAAEEGHETYYRNLDNFMKVDMAMTFSVANVGKRVAETYLTNTAINVFVIYSAAGYPTIGQLRSDDWNFNYPQSRFGVIAWAVPQYAIEAKNFVNLAVGSPSERCVGYTYFHPEPLHNVASSLSPLFEVTLMELAKVNQITDAARVPAPPTTQETLFDPKEAKRADERAGFDKFGITKIYPTRYAEDSSGEQFQDRIWGGQGNQKLPLNNKRFVEFPCKTQKSKWRNVEITTYLRSSSSSSSSKTSTSVAFPGVPLLIQRARTSYPLGYESDNMTSMNGVLYRDGTCSVTKDIQDLGKCPARGIATASDKDLTGGTNASGGRWIGFKTIIYDRTETGNSKPSVMVELWVDENVDDGRGNLMIKNDWRQVSVVKDVGGWIPEMKTTTKAKKKKQTVTKKKEKGKKKNPDDAPLVDNDSSFVVFEFPSIEKSDNDNNNNNIMLNLSSVREIIPPGMD